MLKNVAMLLAASTSELKKELMKKEIILELEKSLAQVYKDINDNNWKIIMAILAVVAIVVTALGIYITRQTKESAEKARKYKEETEKIRDAIVAVKGLEMKADSGNPNVKTDNK